MNTMKNLFFKMLAFAVIFSLLSFYNYSNDLSYVNLSGKWRLIIDDKIDGTISGSNGCDEIIIEETKDFHFKGGYSNCSSKSTAKESIFKGQIFVSKRGTMVSMIQDNQPTDYYSTWSGKLIDKGTIKGIWTDVEGNQGEFKLTR